MYFDRHDIVEAHAIFSHDFHLGQDCELYKRLTRCNKILTGSAYKYERMSANGRVIYAELCERFNRSNPYDA